MENSTISNANQLVIININSLLWFSQQWSIPSCSSTILYYQRCDWTIWKCNHCTIIMLDSSKVWRRRGSWCRRSDSKSLYRGNEMVLMLLHLLLLDGWLDGWMAGRMVGYLVGRLLHFYQVIFILLIHWTESSFSNSSYWSLVNWFSTNNVFLFPFCSTLFVLISISSSRNLSLAVVHHPATMSLPFPNSNNKDKIIWIIFECCCCLKQENLAIYCCHIESATVQMNFESLRQSDEWLPSVSMMDEDWFHRSFHNFSSNTFSEWNQPFPISNNTVQMMQQRKGSPSWFLIGEFICYSMYYTCWYWKWYFHCHSDCFLPSLYLFFFFFKLTNVHILVMNSLSTISHLIASPSQQ